MSERSIRLHQIRQHQLKRAKERITELEVYKQVAEKQIAQLEAENAKLKNMLWQEEVFCRSSGDVDRADEIKAALLEDK